MICCACSLACEVSFCPTYTSGLQRRHLRFNQSREAIVSLGTFSHRACFGASLRAGSPFLLPVSIFLWHYVTLFNLERPQHSHDFKPKRFGESIDPQLLCLVVVFLQLFCCWSFTSSACPADLAVAAHRLTGLWNGISLAC